MNYEQFLWDCKNKAEQGQSKIPNTSGIINEIQGMSTPKVRHYMNNLNSWGKNYLEIGSHKGSTFVSSLYENKKRGWSIDNFSEFCEQNGYDRPGFDGTHKEELLGNMKKYLSNETEFFQEESFSFDLAQIKEPVQVYMYDGDHDLDKQKDALKYYYPVLDDVFLFIVDDWNSQSVRDGTYQGIKDMDLCILSEITIRTEFGKETDWWSGMYSAFLSKECPRDRFLQTSSSTGGCNFAHPIRNSKPRDNVNRLSQPENGKSIDEIRDILKENFPELLDFQIDNEIEEGLKLLSQQNERGVF